MLLKNFSSAGFILRADLFIKFPQSNSIILKNFHRAITTQIFWLNKKIQSRPLLNNKDLTNEKSIIESIILKNTRLNSSLSNDKSREFTIAHHKDGIIEVQLNRPQVKNSISQKILFEVFK